MQLHTIVCRSATALVMWKLTVSALAAAVRSCTFALRGAQRGCSNAPLDCEVLCLQVHFVQMRKPLQASRTQFNCS